MEKIKALFMAQYLGQKVLGYKINSGKIFEVKYSVLKYPNILGTYLLLRSIDQLTDVEKRTLAICYGYAYLVDFEQEYLLYADRVIDGLTRDDYVKDFTLTTIKCFQYLLLIGILLPFTYLDEENNPVTMTTEEIISFGWASVDN